MPRDTVAAVNRSGRVDLSEDSDFFLPLLDDTHSWRERLVEELTFHSASHVTVTSGYQIDFPPALLRAYVAPLDEVQAVNVLLPLTTRPKRALLNFGITTADDAPAALTSRASTAALESEYLRRLVRSSPVADEIDAKLPGRLLEAICVFSPALFEQYFLEQAGDDYESALHAFLTDGLGFSVTSDSFARWLVRARRAGDVLARRLGEGSNVVSSSEQVLLALPALDPRPRTESEVDEVVWQFQRAVLAADAADDSDLLVALAEYGRRYEVVIEVELPVLEPRTLKISEDRPLEDLKRGRTLQRFALGDARSAHFEARVADPNVQINDFDVLGLEGQPRRLGWIESARHTPEAVSIYSSEQGRPYYVDVKLKLRVDRQVWATSLILIGLNLGAIIAVVASPRDAAFVERVAVVVVPTTIAAAFAMVREQTTLASRLLGSSRALIGVTTVLLWIFALTGVITYDDPSGRRSDSAVRPSLRLHAKEEAMAKNGARGGGRVGPVKGRSQTRNPKNGVWTKRDTSTGRFQEVKKSGGSFKGVRREG